jgi:hypothetical protein
VRVAELAASMVWSAPIVALLVLPTTAALGINMDSNPQQAAYLYGMSLIGTWAALIPNKLFENRSLDMSSRRLIALLAGLVVGAVGIVLGRALQLGLPLERHYFGNSQDLEPLYFGALYAASAGWYGLASRNRAKRFRLVPIGLTAVLAGLLTPLWPYARPDCVALAALCACTVQIVSPWSEQGSRYAKYLRTADKQKHRVKTA